MRHATASATLADMHRRRLAPRTVEEKMIIRITVDRLIGDSTTQAEVETFEPKDEAEAWGLRDHAKNVAIKASRNGDTIVLAHEHDIGGSVEIARYRNGVEIDGYEDDQRRRRGKP